MRGLATLSSKVDPAAWPMATAASLPTTREQTIRAASHWVGLTFPGMMLDPGSLAGRFSSARPARGPEPSSLMSLLIFSIESATVFSVPPSCACASCAAKDSNLFGAVTKGRPVMSFTFWATVTAYLGCVFNPVPTAVPPSARSYRSSSDCSVRLMAMSCRQAGRQAARLSSFESVTYFSKNYLLGLKVKSYYLRKHLMVPAMRTGEGRWPGEGER
mmetsp:Transcript_15712/g.39981  ORF Transcript_15712/g.39981 Transcript_15712/m.39981 type:complete len:216 (-) Transcript_15712:1010-1657(-)